MGEKRKGGGEAATNNFKPHLKSLSIISLVKAKFKSFHQLFKTKSKSESNFQLFKTRTKSKSKHQLFSEIDSKSSNCETNSSQIRGKLPTDLKFVGTVGTGGPVKFFLAV